MDVVTLSSPTKKGNPPGCPKRIITVGDANSPPRRHPRCRSTRRPGSTLWYPSLQPLGTEHDVDRRYTTTLLGAKARLWFKQNGQGIDAYISEYEIEFAPDTEGQS